MLKALELQKLSNKSSSKGPVATYKQKTVSRDNYGQTYKLTLHFMLTAHYGKSSISIFQEFLAIIAKIFMLEEDWTPGYISMRFWDFPEILSLKLFGNSWSNLHIPCLLLVITLHFTCGKRQIWQIIKKSQNVITMIVG